MSGLPFSFSSAALGSGDPPFEVLSFRGTDAISRLFRYEIELLCGKRDIDFQAMLEEPAWLGVQQRAAGGGGTVTLKIHGVLSEFEQHEETANATRYRAVLVPRAWRRTLDMQSQIYLQKSVPDIVKAELEKTLVFNQDFEFKFDPSQYEPREYVVQYLESDWNFVQRLCEHVGIFYYFVHEDDREKIVFGDAPGHFATIVGNAEVPFLPLARDAERVEGRGESDWFGLDCVQSLACRQRPVAAQLVLRDYNWRSPTEPLLVRTDVASAGAFGTFYEYGNHYKDEDQGKKLAKVRAEEIRCRQRVFLGEGTAKSFRAGATYRLRDHYRDGFNQGYLFTEARMEGAQPHAGMTGPDTAGRFRVEFASIPTTLDGEETVFRPERVTPKPRVTGALSAQVDAGGSGEYAEIDEYGRYKVKLPFDLSDRSGGQASRFLRMAQPYAGAEMGMHFPLHKGTEVAVLHANGDPDRPFIAGAIPNPDTGSPVCGGNQTQCVIRTGGDNKMVIDDDVGRITLSTPTASTLIRLGEHSSPDIGLWFTTAGHWISEVTQDVGLFVDGAVKEHIKGAKTERVHGMKHIWIGGAKIETIVGTETKQIIGMENKTNVGIKNEITVALGIKIGASAFIKKGPLDKDLKAIAKKKYGQCKNFIGTQADKIGTFARDTAGKMRESASAAAARFGKWKTEVAGPWVTKAADTTVKTAKAAWDSTADFTVKAAGTVKQKASKLKTDVSDAAVKAGGKIKLAAGGFAVKITAGVTKIGTKLKILK